MCVYEWIANTSKRVGVAHTFEKATHLNVQRECSNCVLLPSHMQKVMITTTNGKHNGARPTVSYTLRAMKMLMIHVQHVLGASRLAAFCSAGNPEASVRPYTSTSYVQPPSEVDSESD